MDDPGFGDQLEHRHAGVERLGGILKHHLQITPERKQFRGRKLEQVPPLPFGATRIRLIKPQQNARQRRFAGTAFANDGDRLACHQVEGNALQRFECAVTLSHIAHAEQRFARRFWLMHVALTRSSIDELARIGMLGVAVNLANRADFHQHAFFHHHHPVGDFGDNAEIMGNDKHGHAGFPLQFLEQ